MRNNKELRVHEDVSPVIAHEGIQIVTKLFSK